MLSKTHARQLEQFVVAREDGCHEWTGRLFNGYGILTHGKWAHRAAYERERGPIPPKLTIDHLCRNRRCVNPEHLEPVPLRVNVQRAFAYVVPRRTHCKRGHLWTPENTMRWKTYRYCNTCRRKNQGAYRERKRAGIPSRPIRRGGKRP